MYRVLAPSQHALISLRSVFSIPSHIASIVDAKQRWVAFQLLSTVTAAKAQPPALRNVAVIAQVDHGKTTLMDALLSFAATGSSTTMNRVMDTGQLERERGITIYSKFTSLRHDNITYNFVDTPGHGDFGGEVERVLGTVEGCILLVDALEGPLPQTRFVLGKALAQGLRPIVLLNKLDRPGVTTERCGEVESSIFDTFAALGANDTQLDFPTMFASAREGWASCDLPIEPSTWECARAGGMTPLFRVLSDHVPAPPSNFQEPFRMLVVMTEHDQFLGRIITGKVHAGDISVGDRVQIISKDGQRTEGIKVTKIFKKYGMSTATIDRAFAGDIVSLAGATGASVGDTIAAVGVEEALPPGQIDPPTLSMLISANISPLAGREGNLLTGTKIYSRLKAEQENNVSLHVTSLPGGEAFEVQARGELQLGLLLESMRREGFELQVSPPKVMYKTDDDNGLLLEPMEEVIAIVNDEHAGDIIESLTARRGELLEATPMVGVQGRQRLVFEAPARGLVGYRPLFAALTRGDGAFTRAFAKWAAHRGPIERARRGALIATAKGKATAYALASLEARGVLFIQPGDEIYEGMVVGESSRAGDLECNPVREKKLTNVRNTGSEEALRLSPAKVMTLEDAIGWINADEIMEVTPHSVRIRKTVLQAGMRRSENRKLVKQ